MERQRQMGERNSLVRRSETMHFIAEGIVRNRVSEINVEGVGNLEQLRQLRLNRVPTIIVPNHLTNADTPVIESAMHRNGYSDIADNIVWILGTKLTDRMLTKVLSRGYHYIPVARAPNDENKRFSMMRSAINSARSVSDQGMTLGLFPEGGRSRNKQLIEAQQATAFYLRVMDNMHVVPIAVWGTENVLDVGQAIPRKANANIRIGEPFSAKAVLDKYAKREDRKVIDEVMGKVAELLPEQYRGHYDKRIESTQPLSLWGKSQEVS